MDQQDGVVILLPKVLFPELDLLLEHLKLAIAFDQPYQREAIAWVVGEAALVVLHGRGRVAALALQVPHPHQGVAVVPVHVQHPLEVLLRFLQLALSQRSEPGFRELDDVSLVLRRNVVSAAHCGLTPRAMTALLFLVYTEKSSAATGVAAAASEATREVPPVDSRVRSMSDHLAAAY